MNTKIRSSRMRSYAAAAALAAALHAFAAPPVFAQDAEAGLDALVSQEPPPSFAEPGAAVETFTNALSKDDLDGLARLLGLDPARLRADAAAMETYATVREGAAQQVVVKQEGDRAFLEIGAGLWPLPFPLVRGDDGKWAFDTYAGLEEVINRRVGENELEAISTARAYIDAQREYAAQDRDGDGVLEFAQKLISSDGAADGLYWPSSPEFGESPAGDFVQQAALDAAEAGEGYFGYRFKILPRQGDNIAGGAYDYVINGNMIGGYALLAWPVTYAETGVHSFLVSHHGAVYEADLGPATAAIAKYIDSFNPDEGWTVVND